MTTKSLDAASRVGQYWPGACPNWTRRPSSFSVDLWKNKPFHIYAQLKLIWQLSNFKDNSLLVHCVKGPGGGERAGTLCTKGHHACSLGTDTWGMVWNSQRTSHQNALDRPMTYTRPNTHRGTSPMFQEARPMDKSILEFIKLWTTRTELWYLFARGTTVMPVPSMTVGASASSSLVRSSIVVSACADTLKSMA